MVKILLVLDDPPYGSEHTYNALRLAISLLKGKGDPTVRMFLQGDARPTTAKVSN